MCVASTLCTYDEDDEELSPRVSAACDRAWKHKVRTELSRFSSLYPRNLHLCLRRPANTRYTAMLLLLLLPLLPLVPHGPGAFATRARALADSRTFRALSPSLNNYQTFIYFRSLLLLLKSLLYRFFNILNIGFFSNYLSKNT